jgi:hypothetical protein
VHILALPLCSGVTFSIGVFGRTCSILALGYSIPRQLYRVRNHYICKEVGHLLSTVARLPDV